MCIKSFDIHSRWKNWFCVSPNRYAVACAAILLSLAMDLSIAAEDEYTTGTAFAVSSNGEFLTNAHVVERASSIVVVYQGRKYVAHVLGKDIQNDLAVIKIEQVTIPSAFSPKLEPTKGE